MRKLLYPATILCFGLLSSQVIFSILVFYSDQLLFHNLLAMKNAGYMIVPGESVLNSLSTVKPAFYGGLFFTLTIGAGLSITTFLLIITWILFFERNRFFLIFLLGCWCSGIIVINLNGFNLPGTVAFITIPSIVTLATLHFFLNGKHRIYPLHCGIHIVIIISIIMVGIPKIDNDIFIEIRDHVLLTHPIGKKLNNFYYRYTLYPANLFKSLEQKMLRTCHIQVSDPDLFSRIETRLRQNDYLYIDQQNISDLTVVQNKKKLQLLHKGNTISTVRIDDFLRHPENALKTFSMHCDNNLFFRKFTFISLIAGLPLTCYIILHALLTLSLFIINNPLWRSITASFICLFLGIIFFHSIYKIQPPSNKPFELGIYLKSKIWQNRVHALKKIANENIRVETNFSMLPHRHSAHVQERYWYARSLANNNSTETHDEMLKLLNDPNPNVVCMALYSLGHSTHKNATSVILSRYESFNHWYIQWYAYKALKRLGWKQQKLIHQPLSSSQSSSSA